MTHQNKPPIWLRATVDGPDLGPFRLSQVKQMAANGMVTKDFLIRQGADAPWSSIRRAKGLFPEPRMAPEATTKAKRSVDAESDSASFEFGEESPAPSARSAPTEASSDQVRPHAASPSPSESIDELDGFAEAPTPSSSASQVPPKPAANTSQPKAVAWATQVAAASVVSTVSSAQPTQSQVPSAPSWIAGASSRMALHPAASKLVIGFIALCFIVSLLCGLAVNYAKSK